MSQPKKVVDNFSGSGVPITYDGNDYLFQPGQTVVDADLADFAQAHDPRRLKIVHDAVVHDAEVALEPTHKAQAPEPVLPADPEPEPVLEFTCPQGDWKGNTQEGLDAHLAETHPQCAFCKERFVDEANRDGHVREAHGPQKPVVVNVLHQEIPEDLVFDDDRGGLGEPPKDEPLTVDQFTRRTPGTLKAAEPAPPDTGGEPGPYTPPEPSTDVPPVESPSADSPAPESPSAEPSQE